MNEATEILLVEDDPKDVRLTVRQLEIENIRNKIVVARDGEEALDYLFCRGAYSSRSLEQPPALVLLDLKLPKIDGMEVLRQVKASARTRAIPVVILTSSREERDMMQGYSLGVNSYIQKPVDFEQFRQSIKTLGMYWLVVNQPPPAELFTERATAARES
jgi:two-component system response regulator